MKPIRFRFRTSSPFFVNSAEFFSVKAGTGGSIGIKPFDMIVDWDGK